MQTALVQVKFVPDSQWILPEPIQTCQTSEHQFQQGLSGHQLAAVQVKSNVQYLRLGEQKEISKLLSIS